MPQIQPYETSVLPQGQVNGGTATAADFGGDMGLSHLGAGLGEAGSNAADFETRMDLSNLQAAKAQARATMLTSLQDMQSKLQPGDTSIVPTVKDMVGQQLEQMGQGVQTAAGRRELNAFSQELSGEMMLRASTLQAHSMGLKATQDFQVRTQADRKALYADPTLYTQMVGNLQRDLFDPNGNFASLGAGRTELFEQTKRQYAMDAKIGEIQYDPQGFLRKVTPPDSVNIYRDLDLTTFNPSRVPGGQPASGFAPPKVAPAVSQYSPIIDKYSSATGVDGNIMRAQIQAESSGNAKAVSPAGAVGLTQFMPDTAKRYGIDPSVPEQAIKGQALYMGDLLKQFGGDYVKALAAYHSGENGVQKLVDQYGGNWFDHLGPKGRNYVQGILNSVGAVRSPTPAVPAQSVAGADAVSGDVGMQADSGQGTSNGQPVMVASAGDSLEGLLPANVGGAATSTGRTGPVGDPAFDALSPQEQHGLISQANMAVRALHTDYLWSRQAAKYQKDQQDKTIEDQFLQKLDAGQLSAKDVLSSTLDPAKKEHYMNMIYTWATRDQRQFAKTDPGVFMDLFDRVHLPDGNPNKILDPNDLNKYLGNGINYDDLRRLRQEVNDAMTPDGQKFSTQFKSFMDNAKGQLVKETPLGMPDPKGREQFYNFQVYASQQIDAARKTGENPYDLLNPTSSKYLGKAIPTFQRTMQQIMQDKSNALRGTQGPGSGPKGTPQQLVRKPGESVADYLKRTGQAK